MFLCPFPRRRDSGLLVFLPALGYVGSQRVIGVRRTQEGLDREKNCADLEGGGPVICLHVKE